MASYVVAVAALILRPAKTLKEIEWPNPPYQALEDLDDRPRVLALRRAKSKDASPGIWESLSGRLETGEDPLAAIAREIVEESGLSVRLDPRPLVALQTWRLEAPMVVIHYLGRWLSGEVRLSDEHDAWAWLDPVEFARRCPITGLVTSLSLAEKIFQAEKDA